MATCSTTLYPPAVIASVQKQLADDDKRGSGADENEASAVPEIFQLQSAMQRARLDDTVVSARINSDAETSGAPWNEHS